MSSLIAALRAALSLDTVQFDAGAKRARNTASSTARSINKSLGTIKAVGAGFFSAFSIAALSTGIKRALEYAGSLGEVSQQLGVTTRDLQVFRFAAGQVGVSQEQLETGLSKLTITMGKVAAGAKAPTQALKAIGVSVDELKGKDTGEAFRIIADGLAKIPDRAQRAAVEVALFGKSGAMLDNLLSGGSKAVNQLSQAAEELGIVLSDEQIQKADDTADKLDALKTVLAANIAGVVADNANSIVGLAQSLARLTSEIVKFLNSSPELALGIIGALAGSRFGLPGAAIGAVIGAGVGSRLAQGQEDGNLDPRFRQKKFREARARLAKAESLSAKNAPDGQVIAARRELDKQRDLAKKAIAAANRPKPGHVAGGGNIEQFLATGGGGGKGKKDNSAAEAERARKEALRDAYQFAQDERRANIEILRGKEELATNLDDRTELALQQLQLEHEGAVAEIQYQKDMGEITDAQAKIRIAQEEKITALKKDLILTERAAQQREDEDRMLDTQFNIRRDELQALLNLAQTSEERRRLALELLNLDYEEKRQALERAVANEKLTQAVRDRAQAELDALPNQFSLDRQNVIQGTRGPMEDWMANAQNTSDAFEMLKVQGIEGAIDALTRLQDGFKSFRDAAVSALKDVIAQLIRIQLMKMVANLLGSAVGAPGLGSATGGMSSAIGYAGLPGFASGGSFVIGGKRGVDQNIMAINGVPIAKVGFGERVNIDPNSRGSMSQGHSLTQNFYGSVSRETAMQAGVKARQGIMSANRKGA